jgi:ATP-dependent 26S proteasome regulatory subunit
LIGLLTLSYSNRHVSIALPDRNGRQDIFSVHLSSVKLDREFDEFYRSSGNTEVKLIADNVVETIPGVENVESKDIPLDAEPVVVSESLAPTTVVAKIDKKAAEIQKEADKQARLAVSLKYSEKLSKMTNGFSGADIKNICLFFFNIP